MLQPDLVYTAAQNFPNSPGDCAGGAFAGINDELAWSIILGPLGPMDLAVAAFVGCMMGNNGDGPSKGSGSSSTPSWQLPAHKVAQAKERGWNNANIESVISKPAAIRTDRHDGTIVINRENGNPATIYHRSDGHYVIRDNITNDIVQISDTRKPSWWDDSPGEKISPKGAQ